jgi:glycosyltransferase involved in cell wall biosynthesis
MTTAAVFYQKVGYETNTKRLMGRQAASEGFLKAISRYSRVPTLYCCTQTKGEFEDFCRRVTPWLATERSLQWVTEEKLAKTSEPGVLYRPDPLIGQMAWQRRYSNPRAYSLCGVTHTLASKEAMTGVGDLLIAPVYPWDAVICTSTAVKLTVERLLENWAEYLADRLGARPSLQPQLPVIPLGVDCDAFLSGDAAQTARKQFRQQLGIGAADLVVLFVGRLIFHAKAHPVPMYLALERAAQATLVKVHLVQAGWFEDAQQDAAFKEGAKLFCPTVNPIFVDGRSPGIRKTIWAIADVFISLVDNIQETFGLTPIEAMAAGLPVVVSDWNGYQDTVRHGVDGFRIPTTLPPGGCGMDFAVQYQGGRLNYSTFVGQVSLMTAVDVDACAQALTTLFAQPELRQRMGSQGRQRARDEFDWQVVIRSYETLWVQLNECRMASASPAQIAANTPPYPLCDDPCRQLLHYPTQQLQTIHVLTLGAMATADQMQRLRSTWMTNIGADRRTPAVVIDQMIRAIAEAGSLTVLEILQRYGSTAPMTQIHLLRTLVYLLKFDVLRLQSNPAGDSENS